MLYMVMHQVVLKLHMKQASVSVVVLFMYELYGIQLGDSNLHLQFC
jgi:hypothetical protein